MLLGYFILLVITASASLFRWKSLRREHKWLSFLLVLTIAVEAIARYLSLRFRNDMIAFHIYSPLELLVICCYFNESVRYLKPGNKALWLGIIGLCLSVFITARFQPLHTLNSAFLLFESCCVVALSMLSYVSLVSGPVYRVRTSSGFWITTALFFYWIFSLIEWGMFLTVYKMSPAFGWMIGLLYVFNFAFYSILALVFILYSKWIPDGK